MKKIITKETNKEGMYIIEVDKNKALNFNGKTYGERLKNAINDLNRKIDLSQNRSGNSKVATEKHHAM